MNKKVGLIAMFAFGAVAGVGGTRLPIFNSAGAPSSAVAGNRAPGAEVAAAPQAGGTMVEDGSAVYRVPVGTSPVRGPADALVTFVEVEDFQCPFCKQAAATVEKIAEEYKGKIRVVFKHNPLSFHPNALPAAKLTEEARAQGGDAKFWLAHDKLFGAPSLDRATLESIGKQLALDPAKLKAGLDGSQYIERIREDQNLANSLGARGTPTFFVNGRKLSGAVPFETMKAMVEDELAKAQDLVKRGVRPADLYGRIVAAGVTAPAMIAAPPQAAPSPPPSAPPSTAAKVMLRADDAVKGPKAAPVTIVLFSDFQCPFCSKIEPTVKQIAETYPKDVRIAWKHLPLPFHPNALPAAKAAEAAREQGKFWEMHDKLFASQQSLSDDTYLKYAKELGLDLERFKKMLASDAVARRISEDQAMASAAGATGTPTLFVNCRKVVGAQPFEAFKAVIDEEIAKAKAAKADAGYYDRACAANVAAAPPAAAPAPLKDVKVALRPDDPARGSKDAKVTVVEFSDFQCPFCSRAVPVVNELEKEFKGDVRVVWKHMPLPFHPNALPAAIAAEAARQQGKFWEMHDKLFAGQQTLSDAAYSSAAKEIGLDLGRFDKALKDPATRARVEDDMKAASAAGVTGTPTFVVNGEAVVGSAALKDAVRRHLEQAKGSKG